MAIAPSLSFAATNDSPSSADLAPLSQEAMLQMLTKQLSNHYRLDGELELGFARPWTPPDKVAHDWAIDIRDYPSLPASLMLLQCKVIADGVVVSSGYLNIRGQLWRDVWVVREPLTVNGIFDKSLLDSRRVDAFRERETVPSTVGDASFVFLRAVPSGQFLTWHDFDRRPLVKKGDLVDVTANEGNLSLTMKALAMQSGAQGEAVTVRNLDSRKDFTAVVVDENHVQIRF